MTTAVERSQLVLSVMLSGTGADDARFTEIRLADVKAVVDEILEQQARGGRRLLGLQVDPSLAPGLGCTLGARCTYRSVPVTTHALGDGTMLAWLGPAP